MAGTDALKATFFEECEDLIARMGEGLGRMADPAESHDIELVHDVFRGSPLHKGWGRRLWNDLFGQFCACL